MFTPMLKFDVQKNVAFPASHISLISPRREVQPVVPPHHRNSLCESGVYVVKGCGGSCELDRHVGRAESVGVDRGVAVVDVYMSHYLMAALKRYLFYRMAHLAIPYQCYFHLVSDIMSQKYKKTRRVELLFTLVNSRFVPCPGCRRWLTTALRAGGSGCEVARTMPDRGAAWRCRP